MTKFTTLGSKPKIIKKETIFNGYLEENKQYRDTKLTPNDFDNVLYLGHDRSYGDVFKCWDDDSDNFILYFGVKGDEFDN